MFDRLEICCRAIVYFTNVRATQVSEPHRMVAVCHDDLDTGYVFDALLHWVLYRVPCQDAE